MLYTSPHFLSLYLVHSMFLPSPPQEGVVFLLWLQWPPLGRILAPNNQSSNFSFQKSSLFSGPWFNPWTDLLQSAPARAPPANHLMWSPLRLFLLLSFWLCGWMFLQARPLFCWYLWTLLQSLLSFPYSLTHMSKLLGIFTFFLML